MMISEIKKTLHAALFALAFGLTGMGVTHAVTPDLSQCEASVTEIDDLIKTSPMGNVVRVDRLKGPEVKAYFLNWGEDVEWDVAISFVLKDGRVLTLAGNGECFTWHGITDVEKHDRAMRKAKIEA
ncbi:MAG TPA: hypothetical protein VKT73_15230 [Xanthobacteraceae bacterium]|nr:hypothetical protein [Xanthobacteraceae bacterium]